MRTSPRPSGFADGWPIAVSSEAAAPGVAPYVSASHLFGAGAGAGGPSQLRARAGASAGAQSSPSPNDPSSSEFKRAGVPPTSSAGTLYSNLKADPSAVAAAPLSPAGIEAAAKLAAAISAAAFSETAASAARSRLWTLRSSVRAVEAILYAAEATASRDAKLVKAARDWVATEPAATHNSVQPFVSLPDVLQAKIIDQLPDSR